MTVRALRARHGTAWIAAGSAAIIAGVVGGGGGPVIRPVTSQPTGAVTLTDTRTAPVTLAYRCRFPAGTYQVSARVTVSYPATALSGRAVRPAALTLAVTVPAAALSRLGPPGTAIAVSARLATSGVVRATSGTDVSASAAATAPAATAPAATAPAATAPDATASTDSSRAAHAVWVSLTALPAPLPAVGQDLASGPLRPTAPPPPLTATRVGTMTVIAGSLALRYTRSPSRQPAETVAASCTLEPGQDVTLTTIAVRGARANGAAKPPVFCPPLPPGGLKPNPRLPRPPSPPRGSTITHPPSSPGCAYVKGYSDVRKLRGAALVGPGLLDLSIGDRVVINLGDNYFEEDSAGEFDYRACPTCAIVHALPPARATFLAFGFMPVSGTLQLTEIGTINIYSVGTLSALTANTSWALMSLRVSDVKVNGQPLNVGKDCQTRRPLLIGLTGVSTGPHPYSLQGGGPLTGQITIPPFIHCGVTENLDPLFTGTISGPGNYAELTQGGLCAPDVDLGCPPPIPTPVH